MTMNTTHAHTQDCHMCERSGAAPVTVPLQMQLLGNAGYRSEILLTSAICHEERNFTTDFADSKYSCQKDDKTNFA